MRRFLTLVCLLGLAIPAGISISGCVRNPAGNYCNGLGYGPKDHRGGQHHPAAADRGHLAGLWADHPDPVAHRHHLQGRHGSIASNPCQLRHHQQSVGRHLALAAASAPAPGTATPAAASPTTPTATTPIPCRRPTACPTASPISRPPPTRSLPIPSRSMSTRRFPASVWSPLLSPAATAQGAFRRTSRRSSTPRPATSATARNTSSALLFRHRGKLCLSGACARRHFGPQLRLIHRHAQLLSRQLRLSPPSTPPPTSSLRSSRAPLPSPQPSRNRLLRPAISPPARPSPSASRSPTEAPRRRHAGRLAEPHHHGHRYAGQHPSPAFADLPVHQPHRYHVGGSGSITASYPGVATVTAICQPPTCNPAPINELGLNGTGLSISSNPVNIIVPGTTSDFVWFGAPGQSQYFSSIELLTGTPGSTVRLPYVPNSMVMDQVGTISTSARPAS